MIAYNICIPLPSNQILISKYQASGGVVVSIGWGNGSGWQWNTKYLYHLTWGALDHASSAPHVRWYNYNICTHQML